MATAGDRLTRTRARVLFAVVATLVVAGGALALRQMRESVRRERFEDLASIATIKAEAIAAWRGERCNHVAELAESPFFRRAAAGLLAASPAPGLREEMVVRLDVARRLYNDASVFLATPEGRVLAAAGASPVVDATTRAELRQAVTEKGPFLGDFFRPGGTGPAALDAVAGVADGNGLAVLVLRIDPRRYLEPLIRRWPAPSASAETLLVERRDGDVLFLNEPRFRPGAALTLRQPLSVKARPAAQAVMGRTGPFEGVDDRGVAVLADLRPVPGSPWFLVAKVDRSEILAGLRQGTLAVLAVVLGLVLLAGSGVGYLYTSVGKKTFQRLYDAERERREATEELAATLRGIGDAVLASDAEGRIRIMNSVAEALTGWSEAEAKGRPLEEVFRIINEPTRAAVESPVARVLREGQVVGLANHTLLLARDGREIPIADSGAPVRDEAGRITGVVLIFRDQTNERQARNALEASERRFALFMRHLPAVAVIRDLEGRYVYMNQAWEGVMGLRREDYLGKSPFDCFPREDAERLIADDRRLAESGESQAVEIELHHVSGPRWWLVSRFALHDEGDRPTHVAALYVDITERKLAEARNAWLSGIVESSSNEVYTFEEGTLRFTYANRGALSNLGYTLDELAAMTVLDIKPLVDRERFEDLVVPLRTGVSEIVRFETLHRRKDGSTYPVLIAVQRGEGEFGPVFVAIGTDLTEFKALQEEGKASEARYRALFDNHHTAMLVIDPVSAAIVDANPGAERFYGWSREELTRKTVFDLNTLPPDEVRARVALARSRERVEFEFQHRLAGGGVRDVEVFSGPFTIGSRTLLLSIVHDVSRRKSAEEEKAKLEQHLRQAQKLESIGRLAGGVAHDFNNMLNIITIYAELAMGKVGKGDPLRRDLAEILKAAGRSADLTRQLLAFARKQQVTPRVLDLNATLADMGKMLMRLIGEDISFTFKPGEGLWPVKIDPVQVDQILANLAVNARDAMEGPGRVVVETVNVSLDEGYRDTHSYAAPGDYVLLAFSDTGRGMDAETRAQAFEPFFSTKGQLGTGLGLATVYGIVKQNGGVIHVYSEPGKGTTFKIYLPRWTGEGQPAPTARETLGPRGSETVLVAEDEEAILRLAERILASHGYRVLAAAAPGDALLLAERHREPIHLLLTDVVMPVMNGKELYERIRATRPELKVLYMSGYTADVIANRGIVEDGVAFLQKPFTISGLLGAVRRTLA